MDANIDVEIKKRLNAGDASALALIWDAYSADLLGYLLGVLCSQHDAEDALQDVFVTIARKREVVAKAENLRAYLFRTSRNVAINRMKHSQRRRARENEASEWLVNVNEADAGRSESGGRVKAAMEALPANQRSVIVMKFFRSKSFREIGELLGISENTAGSRYRYGMSKLRNVMRGVER